MSVLCLFSFFFSRRMKFHSCFYFVSVTQPLLSFTAPLFPFFFYILFMNSVFTVGLCPAFFPDILLPQELHCNHSCKLCCSERQSSLHKNVKRLWEPRDCQAAVSDCVCATDAAHCQWCWNAVLGNVPEWHIRCYYRLHWVNNNADFFLPN